MSTSPTFSLTCSPDRAGGLGGGGGEAHKEAEKDSEKAPAGNGAQGKGEEGEIGREDICLYYLFGLTFVCGPVPLIWLGGCAGDGRGAGGGDA
jgi:hypothetical protein